MPTMVERLAALAALFQAGWLTPAEFERAKSLVIAEGDQPTRAVAGPPGPPAPPAPGTQPRPLSPTVTGMGIALGAATAAAGGMAAGGLGG